MDECSFGTLVCDSSPLRIAHEWKRAVVASLPEAAHVCEVDAHNVSPCWRTSDKCEFSAKTIRGKIHKAMPRFLTPFPPLLRHPHDPPPKLPAADWPRALASLTLDESVAEVRRRRRRSTLSRGIHLKKGDGSV